MTKTYSFSLGPEFAMRAVYDASNNPLYIGEAMPGSATSAPAWRVRKLAYDAGGNVSSILWADGDMEMDNIWDNYASLSYA